MLALEERKYETIWESPGGRGQSLREYSYQALTIAPALCSLASLPTETAFSAAGKLSPHERWAGLPMSEKGAVPTERCGKAGNSYIGQVICHARWVGMLGNCPEPSTFKPFLSEATENPTMRVMSYAQGIFITSPRRLRTAAWPGNPCGESLNQH